MRVTTPHGTRLSLHTYTLQARVCVCGGGEGGRRTVGGGGSGTGDTCAKCVHAPGPWGRHSRLWGVHARPAGPLRSRLLPSSRTGGARRPLAHTPASSERPTAPQHLTRAPPVQPVGHNLVQHFVQGRVGAARGGQGCGGVAGGVGEGSSVRQAADGRIRRRILRLAGMRASLRHAARPAAQLAGRNGKSRRERDDQKRRGGEGFTCR